MNAIPAGFESDDSDLELLQAHLKITRLQDITANAGLNDTDFDATLHENEQCFWDEFRGLWNASQRSPQPQLHQIFKTTLHQNNDPLHVALKFFANCPDCGNVKIKSFSYFVLDTTCKIYRQQPTIGEQCDDNTRMVAFNFIKTAGILSLIKAMIETYQLIKIKNLLLPKIREMQDKGLYKESVQWAIHLELTNEFDMLDLAFPLLAQERIALAEEYLDIATHQRLPMVKFLDSLLHRDRSVIEMCEPILERYQNVRASLNVLSYRPLSKLVARLAKKYKFDDSIIPNYKFTKTCSYLHYLYREYQKGNMSVDAYRELVHDNATIKPIQTDIVAYIAANDQNEAVMWYKAFQLSIDECPEEIKQLITDNPNDLFTDYKDDVTIGGVLPPPPSVSNDTEYLILDLCEKDIIIVDTNSKFDQMLQRLVYVDMIYFDSEWKQNICNKNKLCLLQIAINDNVYLIDCLSTELNIEKWQALGANIFNNINILKVGFSIQQDLIMLQNSLPMQLKVQSTSQYLDLRTLWQHLKNEMNSLTLPFGCVKLAGDSLSDLTSFCLGKKLNKTNQCSNWANRPLRSDQVLYAALDARCLMMIFNTIATALSKSGVKMNKIFDKVVEVEANNLTKRISNVK